MDSASEQRLATIFRTLFCDSDLELKDSLTANDVPGWDSFNHVNLILQTEKEFGIRFANSEVSNLKNVGELKALIEKKLG